MNIRPPDCPECKTGSVVTISEIDAGKGATINLMNLGLNIGNQITVSRRSSLQGPVVVLFNDTEIAVGHGLAEKILVKGISN